MSARATYVRRAPAGDRHTLLIASPGADRSLQKYLRSFSIQGGTAHVTYLVPGKYHPTVTLLVPTLDAPSVQINLGKGTLLMSSGVLGEGSRQLNVDAGNAKVLLDGSRSYASLQVNIGMGELKDERPGSSDAHFVVSRQMSGPRKEV